MRSRHEILRLAALGLTDAEVARRTGIPVTTVGRWRRASDLPPRKPGPRPRRPEPLRLACAEYAYLLGLYLGDGCLSRGPRTYVFQVSLDALYPGIIDACAQAMRAVKREGEVHVYAHRDERVVRVQSVGRVWLDAFPQHGPGRKHERPIVLEDWQRAIVDQHPEAFVRGLIHSDGCRTVNRFTTRLPSGRVAEYEYARYFFSNLSADIRALFREYCARLGVRTSLSNARNVSVSDRVSVARLDEFVGPKC